MISKQTTITQYNLINQFDHKSRPLLDGIQGNILKAHGRHHTANVFIRCNGGKEDKAIAWLKSLVNSEASLVQSAYAQLRTNLVFKERTDVDTGLFACIHISAAGYDYLFGPGSRNRFGDGPFRDGMQNAQLNDPPLEAWEVGLKAENHFMLLLAHAEPAKLEEGVERVYRETDPFASITTIERGDALFNHEGAGIEHFGYVDGISQPLFFADEWERYKADNAIVDEARDTRFDPRAGKELVLVRDPFAPKLTTGPDDAGRDDPNALGSYFVFRKLEQNVKQFKLKESELSDHLKLAEGDEERTGAMLLGRFEDGTPVQLDGREGLIHSAIHNNFDYEPRDGQDDASRCPFHAHIRKANPRSGLRGAGTTPEERMQAAKKHIMARRGITYGVRTDEPNDGHVYNKPEKDVGLLFMSYQASIANQFEFIQKQWVNSPKFPGDKKGADVGIDPILGQNEVRTGGEFAARWGDPSSLKPATFDQFVHLKGGEYFFAPSMHFLKNLATKHKSENQ